MSIFSFSFSHVFILGLIFSQEEKKTTRITLLECTYAVVTARYRLCDLLFRRSTLVCCWLTSCSWRNACLKARRSLYRMDHFLNWYAVKKTCCYRLALQVSPSDNSRFWHLLPKREIKTRMNLLSTSRPFPNFVCARRRYKRPNKFNYLYMPNHAAAAACMQLAHYCILER